MFATLKRRDFLKNPALPMIVKHTAPATQQVFMPTIRQGQ